MDVISKIIAGHGVELTDEAVEKSSSVLGGCEKLVTLSQVQSIASETIGRRAAIAGISG